MNIANQVAHTASTDGDAETSVPQKAADPTALAIASVNRTELIERMLHDALDEPSAVVANLLLNAGDLLEMSLILKQAIMEAAGSSSELAELKELQSFIETFLKLCRQADRVVRLTHEISQAPRGNVSAHGTKNHGSE